jgi:hypothetical protein
MKRREFIAGLGGAARSIPTDMFNKYQSEP